MKLTTIADRLFHAKHGKLPVVCIFGRRDIELVTPIVEEYEEKRLDCRCYPSDACLEQVLIRDKPRRHRDDREPILLPQPGKAPSEIQRRWLHYDTLPELNQLGIAAYDRYLTNMLDDGRCGRKASRHRFHRRLQNRRQHPPAVPFAQGTDLYQLGMGHRGRFG